MEGKRALYGFCSFFFFFSRIVCIPFLQSEYILLIILMYSQNVHCHEESADNQFIYVNPCSH